MGTPKLLRLVRALSAYLDHTKATRGEQTKLFISLKSNTSGASIQTLTRWLRETIKCYYESQAPQELTDAPGHRLMNCVHSLTLSNNPSYSHQGCNEGNMLEK